MKNRFNLNEEEKNHIRGLHNIKVINEQVVGYGEQGLDEDAGMDTPGGNPEYFYGDGSLDKLRKFAEEQDSEMSKEDIVNELKMHLSAYRDGTIEGDDLANAFEEILMGQVSPPGGEDDINEQEDTK